MQCPGGTPPTHSLTPNSGLPTPTACPCPRLRAMTLSPGLAGDIGLQGGTGVGWGDSILCAASLGQCCLYHVQLFTARLQLDPKQCCICAIAGFLRQRGRGCEPTLHPLPIPPHLYPVWTKEGDQRRRGDGRLLPTLDPQGCDTTPSRLVTLYGLSRLPVVTAIVS